MSISALKEKFNSLTLESENHWDYRGNNNSERDYVHGFCTYPAMMVPKMQREMLDVCLEHLQDTSIRLLDPFAGSGTILVEGMLRGLNIVGIDINPLAILLCKAKTTILNPTTLHEKTVQLFAWITIHDKTPLYKFDGINKWFTNQAISDLSRIRAGIIAEETIEYRRFFWASFCEVVRIVSNSRDCTYKLHIKEKKDIDAYAVDAVDLFKTTLQYNIAKYNEFYSELQKRGHLKKNGSAYKGQVKIVLSDSIAYLNHSKQKYSLVFTSPPYGDNHTTVSYGQYSIMPLRWINYHDIDEAVDETLLATLYEIDNQSLGGKSSNKALTPARKKVVKKSETLKIQLNQINNLASQQSNKIIAFYSDYDRFLAALSRKMKSNAISVWTLGNRKVAKQEIFMDKIMIELCKPYTNNYRIRFGEVLETVKAVQSNRAKLESFLSGGADITAEDAKAAYEYLEGVDSNMKKFDSIEIAISFPVRRIARLNELTTIDIVKEYGIALSRIGHPFDFSGEISAFE